jgi:Flp pilus assembly secretin CpaC
LAATVQALQQKNLLEILAEPNLLTESGKEASFVSGGEFPYPVVQGGGAGAVPTVTIQFREFGVRLYFTPVLTPEGYIHLKVRPEVSSLDYSNALTFSGYTIPALSTRRVESEMELRDGQSFAIAGLVDNRVTEVASKIPGLLEQVAERIAGAGDATDREAAGIQPGAGPSLFPLARNAAGDGGEGAAAGEEVGRRKRLQSRAEV